MLTNRYNLEPNVKPTRSLQCGSLKIACFKCFSLVVCPTRPTGYHADMFAYEQLFCGAICESSLDSKVSTVAEPTRVARFLVFVVYAPGGQSLGWRRRTHGADRATQDSSTSIIHHRSLSAMAQTYKGGAFRWDRRRCSTSIMKDNRNNTGRIAALSPRLSPLEKGFTLSYDAEACDSQLANTPLACPLHGEARQLQQQLPHPPRKLFSTLGVNRRRRSRSPLPFGRQGWIEALDSPRVAARGSTCDHGGRKNKLAAAAGAAERSRSPGNGWAEPGKGWSRCHRQGGSRQQRTRRSSAHQRLFSRPSGSSCCGGEWTTQQVVPPQQPTSISQGDSKRITHARSSTQASYRARSGQYIWNLHATWHEHYNPMVTPAVYK